MIPPQAKSRGLSGLWNSGISEIHLAWGLLAALAIADVVGMALTGVVMRFAPCLLVASAVAILLLIERIYRKVRYEPRLASLAVTGAQLLVYTAVAGVLSYLLVIDGRPEIDDGLIAADRFLGLDWLEMYAWFKAHYFAHVVMIVAYYSLIPQLIFLQLILFTRGRLDRGRELFWLFVLTSLTCVVISGLFPAAGAFATFHIHMNDPYVQQFLALRSGNVRIIDLGQLQGVVQFPSFHLAMAVILAYAARGIRILFLFLLIWNALVIAATPLVGGHHFADLWGGALVTVGVIVLMRNLARPKET